MPPIQPTHKAIATYYSTLADLSIQGIENEGGLRRAFSALLATLGKAEGWTLAEEQTLPGRIRPDGVLLDEFRFPRGYWEAKDSADDLEVEIRKKFERGYPQTNIIFEDGRRAVLVQNSRRSAEAAMTDRVQLAALLAQFFGHTEDNVEGFHAAVREFQARIPDLARSVEQTIEEERSKNQRFAGAFDIFHTICRQAIDPNISADEIEKMLVQHLLTERLFRTVFDDPDFTRRNAIANEIEKVIRSLTWNRSAFLRRLDPFYTAIEEAAKGITEYAEKQTFLNTVYERFFQGYSREQADTHGVVYTPQPIVDFMVASVDEVLRREFGKSLSDEGVAILDPATGTGNFVVNILRRIARRDLKRKYRHELFANEIMLLPYYIASLNIEHTYQELTGEYAPFEGICFTDTLDLAESQQLSLFAEENTERVERQKNATITVIIGNPPYNVGQVSENDNNKNRRYAGASGADQRVRETYVKDSTATNRNKLGDPYVKFFRWASDRLRGQDGIVCFVSNNSFVNKNSFDGMRKHLAQDFTAIYHIDLHGDVRENPRLSGTTHNVFGIQVGVGITIAIRRHASGEHFIKYYRVLEDWTKIEKLAFIGSAQTISSIEWQTLMPNAKHTWRTEGMQESFEVFLPLGTKEAKAQSLGGADSIFGTYALGVVTNRDNWVYDFHKGTLAQKVKRLIEVYNTEVDRWKRADTSSISVDDFVISDERKIKWSRDLKRDLQRGRQAMFLERKIRRAIYRPFASRFYFFDALLTQDVFLQPRFYPDVQSEDENTTICITDPSSEKPFMVFMTNVIPDLHFVGAGAGTQTFPFYVYDEDGGNRRENITDWALGQFRAAYGESVTKRDIFNYVYGLLHHSTYRERYAENLKRELPRLPLAPAGDFAAFVAAGRRLAELHLGYEQAPEYRLDWIENKDIPFSWRVEKMKLSADKTSLFVNPSLTLAGIPPECLRYRLGNRSALEWVIDQYQVSTDKRSGIVSDPNRSDDEEYIVRLVGRVITVSIETMRIVDALPPLGTTEG